LKANLSGMFNFQAASTLSVAKRQLTLCPKPFTDNFLDPPQKASMQNGLNMYGMLW